MGLFDGHRDEALPTSSAAVARLLDIPVVLVLDAKSCGASLAAIAHGFATFEKGLRLAGVILNRWREGRSRVAVERAFATVSIPILGFVPADSELELPSRHLGLYAAEELGTEVDGFFAKLAVSIESHVDLSRLLELCRLESAARAGAPLCTGAQVAAKVRLGIARDAAFSFYYEDGLDALRERGVELVPFSPLSDNAIPDVDGLYFGGGYPENFLRELSSNCTMLESIRRSHAAGMPIYAECGGLLYLSQGFVDGANGRLSLVGLVPAEAKMEGRLQRMGYREGRLLRNCLLGAAGTVVRGHEFHYSTIHYLDHADAAYQLEHGPEGFVAGNLFASYVHLHFGGCGGIVESLLTKMQSHRERRINGT
jgi:cobyrinic acid a,c-diamide synthase